MSDELRLPSQVSYPEHMEKALAGEPSLFF